MQKGKEESLRGKFHDMRMMEGENITQYGQRIKEVIGGIKSVGGTVVEDRVVSKMLRTLLPSYSIRVSSIQELRSVSKDKVTVDSLIGMLTNFELNIFDNSVPKVESTFKASISNALARKGKDVYHNHEYRSSHHGGGNEEVDDEHNLMEIKALLVKKLPRGTGKYKGNIPLKCFSCNQIGHIATNYPNSDQKESSEGLREKVRNNVMLQ